MKTRLASLFLLLATSGPLLSNTELERLRALCKEQEMQIQQLELKIARLTDTPPPTRANAGNRAGDFLPTEQATPAPAASEGIYTVKAGDSLERIANRHHTSPANLAKLNGLKTNAIIHPGQKIKVPGASPAPVQASAPAQRSHTVKSGDTFYRISMTNGMSVNQLVALNPKVNPNALRVGQVIRLSPETGSQVASAPTGKAASLAPSAPTPISNQTAPAPAPRAVDRPVEIKQEVTYGEFAKAHQTSTARLNELNGLDLDASTVLAKGSELYIPAQP